MRNLSKLKMIKWQYFENETVTFDGQSTVLTGDTGAGKTSLIDALQVIFLADLREVKMNSSAHEQRTERNVMTYLRGKIGDTNQVFRRNHDFTSYLVVEIIHETIKGSKAYLIGVVFDYHHDSQKEFRTFFKIDEHYMGDSLFLTEEDVPKTREEFFRDLNRQQIKYRTYKNDTDGYRSDVQQVLGGVKESFFSLLAKGISFSPITNLRKFIYDYILDEDQVDMSRMQDYMDSMGRMESLINRAEEEIYSLEVIQVKYQDIMAVQEKINSTLYLEKRANIESLQEEITSLGNNIIGDKARQFTLTKRLTELEQKSIEFEKHIKTLSEKILSHEISQEQSRLKNEIYDLEKTTNNLRISLKNMEHEIKREVKEYVLLTELLQTYESPIELSQGIIRGKEIWEELQGDPFVSVSNRYTQLDANWRQSYTWLKDKYYDYTNKIKESKEILTEVEHVITQLKKNNILSENSPSMKLKRLLEEFLISEDGSPVPVNILCEIIDVSDEKWKNAIEGYLHTQKFDTLVPGGYFDQALDCYERHKYSHGIERVGLVNTDKIIEENPQYIKGSLAEEVITDIDYARAYVNRLLGNIMKCEDVSQLKLFPRSITPTCMTYINFTARQISKERYQIPYIGRNAIEHQLKQRLKEQKVLNEEIQEMYKKQEPLLNLNQLNSVKLEKYYSWEEKFGAIRELPQLEQKLFEQNQKLLTIDTSEVDVLRVEKEKVEQEQKYNKNEIEDVKRVLYPLNNKIPENELQIVDRKNEYTKMHIEMDDFLTRFPNELVTKWKYKWEEQIRNRPLNTIAILQIKARENLYDKKSKLWEDLILLRNDFNHEFKFGANARAEENSDYDRRLFFLVEESLIDYKEKAKEAKEMAQRSFKEDFIAKLRELIEKAEDDFKALNRALKEMEFGTDKYSFKVGANTKLKDYYNMLMDPNLIGVSIFTQTFMEKYDEIINDLFNKVSNWQEKGEYHELLDYRSYLEFELEIKDSSQNVTRYTEVALEKSGGETQVPFYVSILASFYYTYQMFRKEDTFRLVIFDEAFNRMDADRIAEAIRFIKNCGFQAIIITPTGSVHMYAPHVPNTMIVLKDNYLSTVVEFSYDMINEEGEQEETDAFNLTTADS